MFCSRNCRTEGMRFHSAERDYIEKLCDQSEDQSPAAFSREYFIKESETCNGAIGKRILQSLAIAGSVERLREIFESSERKTIFDFDLRGQDEQSKNLIFLKAVNSLKLHSSDPSAIQHYEDLARKYLEAVDLTPYVKSESDRNVFEKCLARLLNIEFLNYAFLHSLHEVAKDDGFCFLPFGCLLNHSCDPNVRRISIDDKCVSVVVNPVRKGDQLFISYG